MTELSQQIMNITDEIKYKYIKYKFKYLYLSNDKRFSSGKFLKCLTTFASPQLFTKNSL